MLKHFKIRFDKITNGRCFFLYQMFRCRNFLLVVCISFAIYLYWEQPKYKLYINIAEKYLESDKDNYANIYHKVHKDLKLILLWTEYDYAPFYYFKRGRKSFLKNNCSVTNCYVVTNETIKNFKGDLTQFHAIAFNGRTMSYDNLPDKRSPHQKYIYFNTESAKNYPICDDVYDGFFNWTATYKLNSDILLPYIAIKDTRGRIVGPQTNMRWLPSVSGINETFLARLRDKNKAAAWFVSNCGRRRRNNFVRYLRRALRRFGFTVDVYGQCGPYKCPRYDKKCDIMLERDYFFYLSLENSLAEDYVTEKLLKALQHDVVPIVYGKANYSRFLPPGSYLDSKKMAIHTLASTIVKVMESPEMYRQFFNWKSQYSYSDPSRTDNVCAVCAALNDENKFKTKTVYNQFRKWWNPDYESECTK